MFAIEMELCMVIFRRVLIPLFFLFPSLLLIGATSPAPKIITPNANPNVLDGINTYITAESLYWTANQEELNFATASTNSISWEKQYIISHFDPGYRVSLGIIPSTQAGIDLQGRYTWFHLINGTGSVSVKASDCSDNPTHQVCSIEANNDGRLIDPDILIYETVTAANANWNFLLSTADLVFGRAFLISPTLNLRPFMGLKATWQRQDFDINYTLIFVELPSSDKVRSNQYAYGIGPTSGIETNWEMGKNWSLYGRSTLSLVSTRFKTRCYDIETDDLLPSVTNYNLSQKTSESQGIFELSLGMTWDNWFVDDTFHLGISLGYEMQYWNDNNHLYMNPEDPRHGSLSIQGITLGLRADF